MPVLVGAANLEGTREEGVAFVLDLSARKRAEYLARLVFEGYPIAYPLSDVITGGSAQTRPWSRDGAYRRRSLSAGT